MHPRRVIVVVQPDVHLLDLAGPVQVFDTARQLGADYELIYAADQPTLSSAQGLVLSQLGRLPEISSGDLILLPGTRITGVKPPLTSPALRRWLQQAHLAGAQLASVCSGAFALGEAGLLAGRRCTTHWELVGELSRAFLSARVQDGALFVQDGHVTTSAGIASGIDMALSLLEQEHGPLLTAQVARQLVVYLRRNGAHEQVSVYLEYRTHLHPGVHRVQDHLCAHPARPASLDELGGIAQLSGRHLARAFKAATGLTPLQYQQLLRLEVARTLLHDPRLTVEVVALRCGFQDARHFRRLWRQRFGHAPSASRREVKS